MAETVERFSVGAVTVHVLRGIPSRYIGLSWSEMSLRTFWARSWLH